MWRIGDDGADRWGLSPPSLSLQELLGGVGGSGNESMFTVIYKNVTSHFNVCILT